MSFVITCSILSFFLVLFLRSFFKRKSAFAGNVKIENPEIKKRVLDIPGTAAGALDGGCKAYIIQSLYSRHFIFPEDAALRKYGFRGPLPTFHDGHITSISTEKDPA